MPPHDPDNSWFLAQLKPNAHQLAQRHLARQGFETFLPLEERTIRRAGRFQNALKPLFPGYIFVMFCAAQGRWRAINSTQGITRLVSFGRDPEPVPTRLVEALRRRCDGNGKLQPPALPEPGDKVRVTSGPFSDFAAKVERVAPDSRIWVLIELMGRQTRVAVAPDGILPA